MALIIQDLPAKVDEPSAMNDLERRCSELKQRIVLELQVIARLLDAGKVIFGKLDAKEWRGRWLKLDLRVFLRDV